MRAQGEAAGAGTPQGSGATGSLGGRLTLLRGLGGWAVLALTSLAVLLLVAPPPRGTVGLAACPLPAPRTAEEYTAAFGRLPGGWLGGDQGYSTELPDGRVLWLFSDTLVDDVGAGRPSDMRFIRNSFVLQSDGCFTPLLGPTRQGVLPSPGPQQWYWPQQAVVVGDELWVSALRVAAEQPDGGHFAVHGVDLAEFALTVGGVPRLVAMHSTPASAAGDFGVLWGTGLAAHENMLYVYGTRRTADPMAGKQLLLGRVVSLSYIDEASAWQFRTADGWSREPEDAVVLVPAVGGVSTSLSAHRSGDEWVLVTKRGEFLGDSVVALVGSQPWGPFTERTLFPSVSQGTKLEYCALAHPEVALDDGSLLVSINHNDTSLATVLKDPSAYRPTFHAVPGMGCR